MSRSRLTHAALALSLALSGLTSCRHGTPPRVAESMLPPAPITGPLGARERGRLVSLPDGDWAVVAANQTGEELGELAEYPPGAVVAAWPAEALQTDARPNLFVVTLARSWGLVLQRLDDGPMNTNVKLQMAQATPMSDLSMLGVCFGSGDPRQANCLANAEPGSRFDLYASDRIGAVAVPEHDDRRIGRDVPRAALLHVGPDGQDVLGDTTRLDEGWVAVRSARGHAPWPTVRVSADGCDVAAGDLPLGVEAAPLEVGAATSLFAVEAAAFSRGADVLVDGCGEGDATVFAIPSISRHHLKALTGRTLGPTMLGARPIVLSGLDARQRALVAGALGMAARGDWSAGAMLLERALIEVPGARELARRGMEVIATSGHPSLALRAAYVATQDAWNPDSDVALALGLAASFGALGFEREMISQETRAGVIAEREGGPDALWWRWRQFVIAVGSGEFRNASALERVERAFSVDDDDATWWLALYTARKMVGELDGMDRAKYAELERRARERGGEALWRALDGEVAPLGCGSGEACPLDAYGLVPRENAATLSAALRARPAAWAPGLSGAPTPREAPASSATQWLREVALDALVDPNDSRDALLAHARALGARADARWCDDVRAARATALTLRALPSPRRAASWLTGEAFEAVCEDTNDPARGIERAVLDEVRPPGWKNALAAAVLRGALARATPDTLAMRIERAAGFARERDLPDACAEWYATLSIAHLRARRLLDAQRHAQSALDCTPSDPGAALATQLATGLVVRARQGSLPDGMPADVRARIHAAEAARAQSESPECPGLVRLDDAPALTLVPEITAAAAAIPLTPPEEDTVSLTTRRERVDAAHDLMKQAYAALSAGDAPRARVLLRAARTQAELANDAPLKRTIAMASRALYPEGLAEDKPLDARPADPLVARVRKGQAAPLLAELGALSAPDEAQRRVLFVLDALRAPGAARARAITLGGARALPKLCGP